jgi:hypothetical protein
MWWLVRVHHDDARKPLPFGANGRVHPVEIVANRDLAGFVAIMAAFPGLGEAPAFGIETGRIELAQGEAELIADLAMQAPLIAFDAQDAVALKRIVISVPDAP